VNIEKATESNFEKIKAYISEFDLDNRDLQCGQFLVAKENNKLLGFGRIRKHNGCDEFCSLGVLEEERFNGIAKELVLARIKIATQPIYLVCIIPEYFKKLGFIIVDEFPDEIADKLHYCTSELFVPEQYVVMKYSGSIV
jgi:N-acetylglutamate synthase-like GNAT family acetyltransferase